MQDAQFRQGLSLRLAREEIHPDDLIEATTQRLLAALRHRVIEAVQFLTQRPRLADDMGVVFAAIEQPLQGRCLHIVTRNQAIDFRVAVDLRCRVGHLFQRRIVIRRVRQQIHAVAQGRAAKRLQGAPDPHASAGRTGGQTDDKREIVHDGSFQKRMLYIKQFSYI